MQKSNFMSRFMGYLGVNTSPTKVGKRSFNAVKNHRLNNGFYKLSTDINSDIYKDGGKLMEKTRGLELNSPHVRKYLNIMVNNVVGATGFNLAVRGFDVKKEVIKGEVTYKQVLDTVGNKVVQDSFWEWAKKKNCDITKTYSLKNIQDLIVRETIRDGECLIVKHSGGKEINKWGFALRTINIERLDRNYFSTLPNGNRIVMGVELDEYNRRVAFHIKKILPNALPGVNQKMNGDLYQRIDANDCLYSFLGTHSEQIRGYSSLVAGLETLEHLDGYSEAELINARASAAKMGFFVSNGANVEQLDIADHEDQDGNFISEVEPGTFHVLPQGYSFIESSPDYPQTFKDFVKVNLRTIASAFNISYETLANDRESVNYSSIRQGKNDDLDSFRTLQNFVIENFLEDIYESWLKNAILNKAIVFPNGSFLTFEKYEKFKKHLWRGRGFPHTDPTKEVDASIKQINAGLSSRQREAEKLGVDILEIFEELEQEKKLAEAKGLNLTNSENVMAKNPDEKPEDEEETDKDDKQPINE